MTTFLTWTLYGPLAAWGDIAIGERRGVSFQPSRSAILGWLAGALGIRRTEHDKLDAMRSAYGTAFLVEKAGTILSDFHTSQRPVASFYKKRIPTTSRAALEDPSSLYTTLSRREYSMDALAFAAVFTRNNPPHSLEELKTALQHPVFEPYLGRKSCPTAWPLNPQIRQSPHPKAALDTQAKDKHLDRHLRKHWDYAEEPLHYFWEGDWDGLESTSTNVRRDEPTDRINWYFAERIEHRTTASRGDNVTTNHNAQEGDDAP